MTNHVEIELGWLKCQIKGSPPGVEIDDACSYRNKAIAEWLSKTKPELFGNEVMRWFYSLSHKKQEDIRKEYARPGTSNEDYWTFLKRKRATQARVGMGGWAGGNFDMSPDRAARDEIAVEESRNRRFRREENEVKHKVHLYDLANKTFPYGLLPRVLEVLDEVGYTYEISQPERKPDTDPELDNLTFEGDLWNHQQKAVETAQEERYAMFAIATGGGKSRIAAKLIQEKACKTLVLVNTEELLYQMQGFLQEHLKSPDGQCLDVGLLGDGAKRLMPVTVAIVNSAYNNTDLLSQYGFQQILVDEGHHAASKTYFAVLQEISPYYCYALTGTDFRSSPAEQVALEASFKGTAYRVTTRELVEQGILVPLELQVLDCHQKTDPKLLWPDLLKQAINLSEERNLLLAKKIKELEDQGLSVLVMVDEVPHGQALCKALEHVGVKSYLQVYGNTSVTPKRVRQTAITKLIDREINVLVGTIYNEGVNIPNLDVVVNAAAKKAKIKTFQRLGRAVRRCEGKDKGLIIDVWDGGHRYLEEHSRQRLVHLREAGVDIPERYLSRLVSKEDKTDLDAEQVFVNNGDVAMLREADKLAKETQKRVARQKARQQYS